MEQNTRRTSKFEGYYLEDCECIFCKNYQGKRRGCKLDKCCCDNEKLDAIAKGRIKRKKGSAAWDG